LDSTELPAEPCHLLPHQQDWVFLEHIPRALGVQLSISRQIHSFRELPPAAPLQSVNRWRQQRIRRRFAEASQHLDYGKIKRYCECKLGIPSQCVQYAHVQKAQPQYISNVLMKFNARRPAHSQKL
jgi:hypothetical protein